MKKQRRKRAPPAPKPAPLPARPSWEMDDDDDDAADASELDDDVNNGDDEDDDGQAPGDWPLTPSNMVGVGLGVVGVGLGVMMLRRLGIKIRIEVPRSSPPPRRYARVRDVTGAVPSSQPHAPPPPRPPPMQPPPSAEDAAAAALLGVSLSATVEEIRAAHRRLVKRHLAAGGFGDQHSEPARAEQVTEQINAAKQRLQERARRAGGIRP